MQCSLHLYRRLSVVVVVFVVDVVIIVIVVVVVVVVIVNVVVVCYWYLSTQKQGQWGSIRFDFLVITCCSIVDYVI